MAVWQVVPLIIVDFLKVTNIVMDNGVDSRKTYASELPVRMLF